MRVLLTGGTGLLGQALRPALEAAGHTVVAPGRRELDLEASPDALRRSVGGLAAASVQDAAVTDAPSLGGFDWIINTAAWTDVDGAETNRDIAFRLNRDAAGALARSAAEIGARLLHVSTDYVFGAGPRGPRATRVPWQETDALTPTCMYGRSKAEGEDAVLSVADARPLVVRTSWLYGGGGRNFVDTVRERLAEGAVLRVVDDQMGRPTWSASLANLLTHVVTLEPAFPVLHLADDGITHWHAFATAIALAEGVPASRVVAVRSADRPTPAQRPPWSVLDLSQARGLLATKGVEIPRWRASLSQYLGAAT